MKRNISKLLSLMTLEEKAGLCSGNSLFRTKDLKRLGVPSILFSDGPHGLGLVKETPEQKDIKCNVKSTCFPTGSCLAASWDKELLRDIGEALGKECQSEGVSILLGPSSNIKRTPLCGRNFEYFSEDPYLSSKLAASYIDGVQSQGVGTSLKHFAVYNQEYRRFSTNVIIDERTLREIYLSNFEEAVINSKPWTVMGTYNILNNTWGSQNEYLLTKVLRDEWGFEGFVVSDWGGLNDRVAALKAGLDLEMPSSNGIRDKEIIEAVKANELPESILDSAVARILKIIFKAVDNRKENATYNIEAHHKLAGKAARESIVLLKNENNILPLKRGARIAIIGALAKQPKYQGLGSSLVNPTKVDTTINEIQRLSSGAANILYAQGYNLDDERIDTNLIDEAKRKAAQSEVAVIFAGLPGKYESEDYDRLRMSLPTNHNKLIEEVAAIQSNLIVVLSNGASVEMPWVENVKGILESYLCGQAGGSAIAKIIFGISNPCGKLAETFPKRVEHNPSYLNYPGYKDRVEYKEGIFVGYRYFDTKKIEPLFPFGHGLSYTSFRYIDINVDKEEISDKEILNVKVRIKNTGKMTGKEIVQLYVSDIKSEIIRPNKELKGFEKVELEPGEEKRINFLLDKRSFAYYNTEISDWHVETGEFKILIGSSSRDIRLEKKVYVKSTKEIKRKYTLNSTLEDILNDVDKEHIGKELVKYLKTSGTMFELLGLKGLSAEEVDEKINSFALYSLPSRSNGNFKTCQINEYLEKLNKR